jgi:hypothetical protein
MNFVFMLAYDFMDLYLMFFYIVELDLFILFPISSTMPGMALFVHTLISGFRRNIDEICGRLGYYAALCGNCLPTFRDNVSVPSSWVKSLCRKESQPMT